MIRLCLIGNSHVAALKTGWDRMRAAHPDVSMTFFGSTAGRAFHALRLVDGALVPAKKRRRRFNLWTSNGTREIALDQFDCFVLVGLGFGPQKLIRLAGAFSFADSRLDPSKRLISRECFEQTITDGLERVTAAATARMIQSGAGKPVLLVPPPGPSVEVTNTEAFRTTHGAVPTQGWTLLRALWTQCALRVAAGLGSKVVFQPDETIRNELFTAREFGLDSVRLTPDFSKKHIEADLAHMNHDYGMVVLESVLAACGAK